MKYELRQMHKQESASIAKEFSIGELIGLAKRNVYHASKHGVIGMTKSAARKYAARGIHIKAICSGIIETPMLKP